MKSIRRLIFAMTFILFSFISHAEELRKQTVENKNQDGKVEVSTGKYITGGILGSVIGFGIGHAVQGRYAEKGLLFSVGEAVGFTLVISGAVKCIDEKDKSTNKECSSSANSQILIGGVAMLGLHIWEIVDVWTGATPVDDKISAILIPNPKSPGIGFVYNF
ncbi:MAG: hypothetical protein WA160_04845 [Pseudobdellovibrio sp.]